MSQSTQETQYKYIDATGTQQGPITGQRLQALAAQGIINRETRVAANTGFRGTAGQISWLKFPPPPKQWFCTNCGNAVSENAKGCQSCGLKHTGHKRFCCHCGGARNPDPKQIVCTHCGEKFPIITIPKPIWIEWLFNIEAVKKLFAGGIALAVIAVLIWFGGSHLPSIGSIIDYIFGGNAVFLNQLKSAKSGDWAEYEYTISGIEGNRTEKMKVRTEVLSKGDKNIKIETTTQHWISFRNEWSSEEKEEMEIDLSVTSDEQLFKSNAKEILRKGGAPNGIRDFVDKIKFEIKRGRMTSETLSTAGQSFSCHVTPLTFSVTVGSLTGTVRDIRVWLSSSAPFGLVQGQFRMDIPNFDTGKESTFEVTVRLTAFRKT